MKKYIIKVTESVNINKDVDTVYNAVCDVKNWDKLSGHFKGTKVIMREGDSFLTKITSMHNKMEFNRYTLRECKTNEYMKFNHISVQNPLTKHFGIWVFKNQGNNGDASTQMSLEHNFRMKFGLIGYFFGKIIVSPFFFRKPTKKMLGQMKQSIEEK
jgi:ribosome-associated toxin RatA of RatAB toxin-antitoxin module